MGQSHSTREAPRRVTTEELGHELALRFATKCFTHLEITHFKDNFKTLANHQDNIEYWKEETLCRFLSLPDALEAGSIIYRMATYLGAFPFPSLAPCILTREAMLKVITIMTERYSKILKRGKQDKIKLLFRSLAVYDNRTNPTQSSAEKEKVAMEKLVEEQKPDEMLKQEKTGLQEIRSHVAGFAIDEPANDDEEEDDDELALAALEALDAIEVFKQDQKMDRKIHNAQVPVENFKKLLMLLLVIAPLEPQENLALYGVDLTKERLRELRETVDSIVAAFETDEASNGIRYSSFVAAISGSLPLLFDPLNALFEHFLFSKNIDLSKHRRPSVATEEVPTRRRSLIFRRSSNATQQEPELLTSTRLSHLSSFLSVNPSAVTTPMNLFRANARFHPLYSTTLHGTSLSSFSRQVSTWQSSTLLLVSGSSPSSTLPIVLGAFFPQPWSNSSSNTSTTMPSLDPSEPKPTLFQLSPRHAVFPCNPYNKTTPTSYFSLKTGIALGCVIPVASRSRAISSGSTTHLPILGPVSLLIDEDLSTATFQHDADAGVGAFLPDPGLEAAQSRSKASTSTRTVAKHSVQERKLIFDIDVIEFWGVDATDGSGAEDAATKQRKQLEWEEAEAARRRGVNFGGDKDGARALLEMAGLVGDHTGVGRSGGSV